jgi:UDP-N-acetyl-D-mannosaminuronic acid dehydrogenase
VIENVQRDVNIAIVQELAAVCEAAGIDVREVIALANTHRRVHLLDPGPGVGGYCIPNALHYLTPLTRTLAVETPTLQSARRTNRSVPQRIVAKVLQHLAHQGVNPAGARVAILGLAMKDFSNDDRQSPALDVAHGLAAAGLWVRAFDPAVPPDHPYPAASAAEAAAGAHALLILARQEGMDPTAPEVLEALAPGALVVDTRGTFRTPERRAVLSRMGYSLWSL